MSEMEQLSRSEVFCSLLEVVMAVGFKRNDSDWQRCSSLFGFTFEGYTKEMIC